MEANTFPQSIGQDPEIINQKPSVSPIITGVLVFLNIVLFIFLSFGLYVAATSHTPSRQPARLTGSNLVIVEDPNKLILPISITDSRLIGSNLLYSYKTTVKEVKDTGAGLEIITNLKTKHPPFVTNENTLIYFYYDTKPSVSANRTDIKPGQQVVITQFYFPMTNVVDTHIVSIYQPE